MAQPTSFTIGIFALILCIIVYLVQTNVIHIFQQNEDCFGPFFLLWFSHCCFVVILLFHRIIREKKIPWKTISYVEVAMKETIIHSTDNSGIRLEPCEIAGLSENISFSYKRKIELITGMRFNLFVWISIGLAFFYSVPNALWYVAIKFSTMTDVTALFNMNVLFCYLFSRKSSIAKLFLLVLCGAGVYLMGLDDELADKIYPNKMLGNVIAILSAIIYGVYQVAYKKIVATKDEETLKSVMTPIDFINFQMDRACQYIGYIGVFTLLTQWPFVVLFHFTGFEVLKQPNDSSAWGILALNAFSSVAYNTLYMLAISWTDPFISSLAILTTIPFSALVDIIAGRKGFSISGVAGLLLIFSSLAAIAILEKKK